MWNLHEISRNNYSLRIYNSVARLNETNFFNNVNGFENISEIKGGDDDLLMHKIINIMHCKSKFISDSYNLEKN